MPTYQLQEPLADKTTMRVGGAAARFTQVDSPRELRAVLTEASQRRWAVSLLGGGSNLIVSDAGIDACVVRMAFAGTEFAADSEATCLVTADAGMPWDELARLCAQHGLWGIECLSGIPGSVGAAPVQNIGAYGQSLSDTLMAVRLQPIDGGDAVWQSASALRLGYRTSALKENGARSAVTGIRLRLSRKQNISARARLDFQQARDPMSVREQVMAIREQKGMLWHGDGSRLGTVGSFFLNPILSAAATAALRHEHPSCPTYEAASGIKVAAAWLIEAAGLPRGHLFEETSGRVGLSPSHALSIVNRGNASAHDIVIAARQVVERVWHRFGIMLSPEARFVGFGSSAASSPGWWPGATV